MNSTNPKVDAFRKNNTRTTRFLARHDVRAFIDDDAPILVVNMLTVYDTIGVDALFAHMERAGLDTIDERGNGKYIVFA